MWFLLAPQFYPPSVCASHPIDLCRVASLAKVMCVVSISVPDLVDENCFSCALLKSPLMWLFEVVNWFWRGGRSNHVTTKEIIFSEIPFFWRVSGNVFAFTHLSLWFSCRMGFIRRFWDSVFLKSSNCHWPKLRHIYTISDMNDNFASTENTCSL